MEWKPLLREIGKFLLDGFACALNNSCNIVVIFVNFVYIGMLNDPLLEASFGLGVSYFMFLFMSLNLGCFEVTGIDCAYWWGLTNADAQERKINKSKKMSAALAKGCILLCFVLCFSVIMFIYAENVLLAISIAPENAVQTGGMVLWLIPGIILQGFNFQVQAFILAQGVTIPFGVANILSIVVCSCICNYLTFDLQVGILLFPVCKTIMEVINFFANLYAIFFSIQKGSIVCISFAEVKEGLGKFLCQGCKFIIGLYAEFLGFEFNTYLASLTHDQYEITAFVSWVNIAGFLFTIGLGFSNVTRQRVSGYIGKKSPVQAMNAARFFTFMAACVGMIFLILIECLRYPIASIYTPFPEIQDIIAKLLVPYGFGAVFELIVGCQNTLMRLTGRAMVMTYLMLGYFVISLGMLSYLLGFVAGLKVPGMVLAFVIVTLALNVNYFVLINFRTVWEELEQEEEGPEAIESVWSETTGNDSKLQFGPSTNELANGVKK
jgi:Na+-driven multidrug efflux pump